MDRAVVLRLPLEFMERCRQDGVMPEVVLLGFIDDLCDIGSDAAMLRADVRFLAQEYYALAGYAQRRGFT